MTNRRSCGDHRVGPREEWLAARAELAQLEAEQAELEQRAIAARRALPWVAVEKEYVFDTESGKKTLGELFDGRRSCSPTTSCMGPITRSAPVRLHKPSPTSSTARRSI